MKRQKVSLEQTTTKTQLIGYLEDMVSSLKSGTVVIEFNGDYVRLVPPDSMKMAFSARQKKEKSELEIAISWATPEVRSESASLRISAEEPSAEDAEGAMPAQ